MTDILISGRCRCCLQEDPGLNLFTDEDSASNIKLCNIYQDCTNIILDKRQEKPQGLCYICLEQMMTAYNFIKQCKDVNDYLNTIFGEFKYIKNTILLKEMLNLRQPIIS